jgi:hypothetical protein
LQANFRGAEVRIPSFLDSDRCAPINDV